MKLIISVLTASTTLFLAPSVHAGELVGRIQDPAVSSLGINSNSDLWAGSFALDSTFNATQLDSISVFIQEDFSENTVTLAKLYSNQSGAPGTELVDLGSETMVTNAESLYTFQATNSFILQPSSVYWVVFTTAAGIPGIIDTTTSALDAGSNPAATMPLNVFYSGNGGTTWANAYTGEGFRFAVNEVPEPASASLLALGALGLFTKRPARRQAVFTNY